MKLPPEVERRVLELASDRPALPPLSEKAFMADVVKLARFLGWKVFHPFDSRRSDPGYPDLTLVRERVVVAELKVEPNRPTAEQERWLDAFRAAGVPAFVWYPENWAEIRRTLEGTDR